MAFPRMLSPISEIRLTIINTVNNICLLIELYVGHIDLRRKYINSHKGHNLSLLPQIVHLHIGDLLKIIENIDNYYKVTRAI